MSGKRKCGRVILMIFLIWFAVGVIQNRESMVLLFLEGIHADTDSHDIMQIPA